MEQEKLIEFNKELADLLKKYNVVMSVRQNIVVNPAPTPKEEKAVEM